MEPLKMVEQDETNETQTDTGARVIRTGFRRTDERTGRTVEMLLCSEKRKVQSYVFFVDSRRAAGKRVMCPFHNDKHSVIDPIDAVLDARLSADDGSDTSCTNLDVCDLLPVIIDNARQYGGPSSGHPRARSTSGQHQARLHEGPGAFRYDVQISDAAGRRWNRASPGFLLFDEDHPNMLYDPANRNASHKYRKTLWEVHPITKIEVWQSGSWVDLEMPYQNE